MAATIGEIKVIVQSMAQQFDRMDGKFDELSKSVIAHHALDVEKCKILDQLHMDIHGDGNGRKGIRRELDSIMAFVESARKVMWVAVGGAITSVIGAFVSWIMSTIK